VLGYSNLGNFGFQPRWYCRPSDGGLPRPRAAGERVPGGPLRAPGRAALCTVYRNDDELRHLVVEDTNDKKLDVIVRLHDEARYAELEYEVREDDAEIREALTIIADDTACRPGPRQSAVTWPAIPARLEAKVAQLK